MLQRNANWKYCEAMTRQFTQSARQVVFSYARNHDETSMQPSPLIRSITEIPAEMLISQFTLPQSEVIFQSQALEEIMDVTAPPLQPNEAAVGGVEIIKNQALCPFKAFAECRLRARELENPLPGYVRASAAPSCIIFWKSAGASLKPAKHYSGCR